MKAPSWAFPEVREGLGLTSGGSRLSNSPVLALSPGVVMAQVENLLFAWELPQQEHIVYPRTRYLKLLVMCHFVLKNTFSSVYVWTWSYRVSEHICLFTQKNPTPNQEQMTDSKTLKKASEVFVSLMVQNKKKISFPPSFIHTLWFIWVYGDSQESPQRYLHIKRIRTWSKRQFSCFKSVAGPWFKSSFFWAK